MSGCLSRVVPGASLSDGRRSCQFSRARDSCSPDTGPAAVASPGGARLPRPGRLIAAGARQLRQRTARAAQLDGRRLGRSGRGASRGSAEADYRDVAHSSAAAGAAPLCRARRRLLNGAARCGPAHDDECPRGVAVATAEAALRSISDRSRSTRWSDDGNTPDPRAAAGARGLVRRPANARRRSGEARRLQHRRRPGSDHRETRRGAIRLGRNAQIAVSGLAPMRSSALARSVDCGAAARQQRGGDWLSGDRARRCYRLRQDGDLFCRARRGVGRRTAGARAVAGDRPRPTMARALPTTLRRASGAVAFRHDGRRAPGHLAGRRGRPGARGRRRSFGAVPAFPGA